MGEGPGDTVVVKAFQIGSSKGVVLTKHDSPDIHCEEDMLVESKKECHRSK